VFVEFVVAGVVATLFEAGPVGYEKTAEIPAGRGLVNDFCGVGFVVGRRADEVEL
jgi:hypothetical protein